MEISGVAQERAKLSRLKFGMITFLISEAFLFGSLFWTYYYLRSSTNAWPPQHPLALLPSINTVFLLASSLTIWLASRAIQRGSERGLSVGLGVTLLLGITFIGITMWEWDQESFRPWTDAYGSIFYTLTGFHALHVFGGALLMLALLTRSVRHRFSADNFVAVDVGSLYWHFVDFIWILVFTTIFIVR